MNTSLTKGQIKFITDLHQKEGRTENGCFVVEGEKLVNELLASGLDIHGVFHTREYKPAEIPANVRFVEIKPNELERISALKTPNKVVAVAKIPVNLNPGGNRVLYGCGIQDPGNAGTIIRIADWFGITRVVLSPGSADVFAPKVVQASMGAVLRVPVQYDGDDLPLLQQLKAQGYTLYTADMEGTPLAGVNFTEKAVLVMGNEAHGILPAIKAMGVSPVTIPGGGGAESLNVAVACGIICARWVS